MQVKKGLYLLGEEYRANPVSLPLVANLLYGPSCVSLDFALAWHGLIPEAVFTVTSITPRRAKDFHTGLGYFTYEHVPEQVYPVGLMAESNLDGSVFLLAGREKALCDKILLTRNLKASSKAAMRSFLLEDLRIEPEELACMDIGIIDQYRACGRKTDHFSALNRVIEELNEHC